MGRLDERQHLAKLTPEERVAVFEELHKKKRAQHALTSTSIRRRKTQSPTYPLSFAQQRLWFLEQLEPDTPLYNTVTALRLRGRFNHDAFRQALESIVTRHETLRTTFVTIEGEPRQAITNQVELPLPLVDLHGLPEALREHEALRIADSESQRPFDLRRGPLLRATFIQIYEEEHILLFTIHHIATDGWSEGILLSEVMALYAANVHGDPSPLPELPIQYIDFALWQRERLQGKVLEELLSYWKQQLADLPTLHLPTDHPRPVVHTIRGALYSQVFPPELLERLQVLSLQEDTSLFMTLLAIFTVVLSRYTGTSDIPVGTSIANRNRAEIEGLIGFFVNTLVLRTRLAGNPSFRELLKRVREVCLDAYAHQDLPFEQLVDEMQPERNLSRSNPLIQVMFVLQNTPTPPLEEAGLTLEPLMVETHTSKFDLSVFVLGGEQKTFLEVEYNSDLFEETTISRMLEHFFTLAASVVANPEQTLSSLSLLSPMDQRLLLAAGHGPRNAYPTGECLHDLITAQVARTPDVIALVFEDEQLTYEALDQHTNRLAHRLCRLGVAPETRVGLYLDRSLTQVAVLLAVLKAGGSYVPLDPAYPHERVQFMVEDAQIALLITQQKLRGRLTGITSVLCVDAAEDQAALAAESDTAPCSSVRSENLAYILYTSGSTGKPKGVCITHRSAVALIHWGKETFSPHQLAGVLASTSFCFDLSIFELFVPLSRGGSAVLVENALRLFELSNAGRITLINTVPTVATELVRTGGIPPSVHVVNLAGEPLRRSLVQQLYQVPHIEQVVNLYGPTEDTTYSTWTVLTDQEEDVVSIGRPLPDTQVYLLDTSLHLTPRGLPGELYLAGAGLARGYLNRPALTAERFVPHPFSTIPGARLYRTGDLARYLPDGSIEFLGRVDQQVKIRGYRIELGEIEAALRQHPVVQDTIVIARDVAQQEIDPQRNAISDKRLFAYIVRRQQHQDAVQKAPTEWSVQQVAHWQHIFDTSYRESDRPGDPTFNISGWKSSYTGQSFAEEEMRGWVNQTVERILSLHPRRILEIGCGTGLLLFQIASACEEYWGTDFSPAAIQELQTLLREREIANVRLLHRDADDFSGLLAQQQDAFDVVVLNSVVQYFPSVEYLLRVLEGALQLVAPGGFLFVGDVRNLVLLEAFHTSVQLRRAAVSLLTSQLRTLIERRLASENELLLDPAFFFALQHSLPQISHVELQLKRGRHHNELTRFRYDVILHKEREIRPIDEYRAVDWQKDQLTLSALQSLLEQQQPKVLHISRVPNARLAIEMQALSFLRNETTPHEVGALWKTMSKGVQGKGIEPEDIWGLGERLSYHVTITWSGPEALECYDVLLVYAASLPEGRHTPLLSFPWSLAEQAESWSKYANNPFKSEYANNLIPELRAYLKQRLPDHMLPAALIELNSLPLLPNGKVDHKALPASAGTRPVLKSAFVAPSTTAEQALAEIWSQCLGIEQIGIHDNFFELGGDSLMTVRVVTKANQAGLGITVKQIFQHQTIAELVSISNSAHILAEQGIVTGPVPIMPAHRANLEPGMGDPSCHSMAYIVEAAISLAPALVERVVRHLLTYHDALRTRAIQTESGWELFNAGLDADIPFQIVDFSHLPEVEQISAVMALAARLVMHFNLAEESLLRVALCHLGPGRPTPLVVAGHSLVVDMQSWQILLEDLKTAYRQLKDTGTIHFPPKTTAYQQWANRLVEYTQSEQIQAELSYWLSEARKHAPSLPLDYPEGVNDGASTQVILELLSIEETEALKREVARRKGLRMDAVFLTAVAQAVNQWSGQPMLHVMIEGYGREPLFEDIDLSRTLGTLVMEFPLLLDLAGMTTPQEALQAVHEQLRQVPNRGIGYSALRYMSKDRTIVKQLESLPQPDVFYNYLGPLLVPEIDDFKVAGPFNGRAYTMDQIEVQPTPLMVTGMIDSGQFQVTWYYSTNQYAPETVEQLARTAMEKLRAIIKHFQSEAIGK